jgi:hypothetical protein
MFSFSKFSSSEIFLLSSLKYFYQSFGVDSRCPKGNAAEAVATRLDKKLRENLRDARNSLFANDGLQVPKMVPWQISA